MTENEQTESSKPEKPYQWSELGVFGLHVRNRTIMKPETHWNKLNPVRGQFRKFTGTM